MSHPIHSALAVFILALPSLSSGAPARSFPPAMFAQAATSSGPALPPAAAPDATVAPAPSAVESRSAEPPLTGGEAWKALVGNTVSGVTPDGPYTDYFAPDGTVVHVDRDGKESGRWVLKDPSICFTYPDDDEDEDGCRELRVKGAHGAFLDSNGSAYGFDIKPGNPEHL